MHSLAGAAGLKAKVPGLQILAEEGTARFLREKKAPRRRLPTRTFKDRTTLKLSAAAQKHSWDSRFAIFRTLIDGVIDQWVAGIQGRWGDWLAGVDVFGSSHCRAALICARWDD